MNPKERVVSSRVIGRKVLGSASPLAKGFRETKQGCADSISGVFFGFIIFALAFWPAWCSVKGVEAVSEDVAALELLTPAQAEGRTGMVKVHGMPEEVDFIELDIECRDINEEVDVFWYHTVLKEYTEHPEKREHTETRTEGGQEVEYTVEEEVMVQDWEVMEEQQDVAGSFMLGEIEVDPSEANDRLTDYETCEDKGRERLGEEWLLVEYLPVDNLAELLVVGEIRNNSISGGEPFIVTDRSAEELVGQMAAAESGTRTMLTILSIVMFFISFNLIIGPLLFLLKYVPFIGGGLRFGIAILSLILAIVWVLILKFIIAFWWLILVLLAILIILLVAIGAKRAPKAAAAVTEAAVEPPLAAIGEERSNFCPKCGDKVEPGEKFCDKCGEKLS